MKLFFISDIHGNQFALARVLAHAANINSDMIFCAGDMSGYFTGVNEVVKLLKKYDVKTILGNHDAFMLGLLPISNAKSYYNAFLKSRQVITAPAYKWLKGLNSSATYQVNKVCIKLYHGGPSDELKEYIYPDKLSTISPRFNDVDMMVFGHTHLQFGIKEAGKIFINPGSVGLPRNGDYRAHGISYDTTTGELMEHRVSYDLNAMINYYLPDKSINPIFFHNVNFGRSSQKALKAHLNGFLTGVMVSQFQAQNIKVINTKFGAVLCMNDFSPLNNVVYIASYNDDTVELTTSALQFNWQQKFNSLQDSSVLTDINIINDSAGTYHHIKYQNRAIFDKNILTDVNRIFQLLKNYPIKNVEI